MESRRGLVCHWCKVTDNDKVQVSEGILRVLTHAAAPGARIGAKGHKCEGSGSIACLIAKK